LVSALIFRTPEWRQRESVVCKCCDQPVTVGEYVEHVASVHPDVVAANIARGRDSARIYRRIGLLIGLPFTAVWLVVFVYTLLILRASYFPGYPLLMLLAPFVLILAAAAYASRATRSEAPKTSALPGLR